MGLPAAQSVILLIECALVCAGRPDQFDIMVSSMSLPPDPGRKSEDSRTQEGLQKTEILMLLPFE